MQSSGTPPYLNISPDTALQMLGAPFDTDAFGDVARRCERGRDDLIVRGLNENDARELRLFSIWEITKYLIPVAPAHFRRVLRANPDLPQGVSEMDGRSKWFTLEDVEKIRAHFDQEGSKTKEYLPYRPKNASAKIVGVANFKGGVGKTSTTVHLAMSAALDGYKVLVIDLDSQGSMSSFFGTSAEDEWGTVFPLLARHYAMNLRQENNRRLERGDTPRPLDDTLGAALDVTTDTLIRKTHWSNIDLIPAQMNLYWSEFQIPVWRMGAPSWKMWDALQDMLEADGILDQYDLIFLDTPPALGYLTINGLAAADILLVPVGASFVEFDSTGRFFDMLHATFKSIEDSENVAARALGKPEIKFEWDAVRTIITRYNQTQQGEMAALMQAYMGPVLVPERQDYTALIEQAGESVSGIYEADYRDFNRETYARGRAIFDDTYAVLKRLLIGAWQRDSLESVDDALQPESRS